MTKHQKHTKLKRPAFGNYAGNEWGLVGTNCGLIQKIATQLNKELRDWYRIGYMDADHQSADELKSDLGFKEVYTDKIHHHQFETGVEMNDFDFRIRNQIMDLVLINSNHFQSQKQIVFIDEKKEQSLLRRIDQLNDIRAVILKDNIEIFDFIKEKIKNRNVPILKLEQIGTLASLIETDMNDRLSVVKGLILAGGKSQRMGHDKSKINYHGTPHVLHIKGLLSNALDEVYISVAKDSDHTWEGETLEDSFTGLGPFGAILSAFRSDPTCAWLVVACDLPFVTEETINTLLDQRDISKYATAFHNPETGFPDPLITLWEPRAYSRLMDFLAMGYSCPRKVLINSDINEISTKGNWLKNVNHPEDLDEVQNLLSKA